MLKTIGLSHGEMIDLMKEHAEMFRDAAAKKYRREQGEEPDELALLRLGASAQDSAVLAVVEANNQKILADLRDAGLIPHS